MADTPFSGAGILPFMVDERGVIRFVLGKEKYTPSWRGSCKWSAFEGGRKGAESIEENAVREFDEETVGAFSRGRFELREELRATEYAARVALSVSSAAHRTHYTFVKQWEWTPDIEARFLSAHGALEAIADHWQRVAAHERRIVFGYPCVREGDVVLGGTVVAVEAVELAAAPAVLRVRCCVRARGGRTSSLCVHRALAPAQVGNAEHYRDWFASRVHLTTASATASAAVRRFAHVETAPNGLARSANVNHDALEKAAVRAWSIDELVEALECEQDIFRPYFVTVLRQTLGAFQAPRAGGG